jgi:hypothetical protein
MHHTYTPLWEKAASEALTQRPPARPVVHPGPLVHDGRQLGVRRGDDDGEHHHAVLPHGHRLAVEPVHLGEAKCGSGVEAVGWRHPWERGPSGPDQPKSSGSRGARAPIPVKRPPTNLCRVGTHADGREYDERMDDAHQQPARDGAKAEVEVALACQEGK